MQKTMAELNPTQTRNQSFKHCNSVLLLFEKKRASKNSKTPLEEI
uniref:Uncharacterized protein n=1 Tax=Nelumbo nucifera TaxID=4432 RepID=A0A822YCF2_NELNU|nr:TPA_asm: hypothetical protein HUJ06_031470 [Nelumbo nucifera]